MKYSFDENSLPKTHSSTARDFRWKMSFRSNNSECQLNSIDRGNTRGTMPYALAISPPSTRMIEPVT